jgi:hypothetical protein
MLVKYVWYNIQTGKFSDSWDENTHKRFIPHIENNIPKYYILLKYECINKPDFEFYHMHEIK